MIDALPPGSATAARMAADPTREKPKKRQPGQEWRDWHGYDRVMALLVDLYDLTAAGQPRKRRPKPHPARPKQS